MNNNITPQEVIQFCSNFFEEFQQHTEIEYKALCPFHNDTSVGSFFINVHKATYYCFSCGASGSLFSLMKDKKELQQISNKEIYRWKDNLFQNKKVFNFVINQLQWSKDIIDRNNIGYDNKEDYITIPVYNHKKECYFIKNYNPTKIPKYKYYPEGYNELYPYYALYQDEIIICEGEKDCLRLRSEGFNAITMTSGASSFKVEWVPLFKKKEIFIVFDRDKAGIEGSKRIFDMLQRKAKSISIVRLPFKLRKNKGKDVTDYFNKYNKTREDFKSLLENTNKKKSLNEKEELWIALIQSSHLSEKIELKLKEEWVPAWVKEKDLSDFNKDLIKSLSFDSESSSMFAINYLYKLHLKKKLLEVKKELHDSHDVELLKKQSRLIKEIKKL